MIYMLNKLVPSFYILQYGEILFRKTYQPEHNKHHSQYLYVEQSSLSVQGVN